MTFLHFQAGDDADEEAGLLRSRSLNRTSSDEGHISPAIDRGSRETSVESNLSESGGARPKHSKDVKKISSVAKEVTSRLYKPPEPKFKYVPKVREKEIKTIPRTKIYRDRGTPKPRESQAKVLRDFERSKSESPQRLHSKRTSVSPLKEVASKKRAASAPNKPGIGDKGRLLPDAGDKKSKQEADSKNRTKRPKGTKEHDNQDEEQKTTVSTTQKKNGTKSPERSNAVGRLGSPLRHMASASSLASVPEAITELEEPVSPRKLDNNTCNYPVKKRLKKGRASFVDDGFRCHSAPDSQAMAEAFDEYREQMADEQIKTNNQLEFQASVSVDESELTRESRQGIDTDNKIESRMLNADRENMEPVKQTFEIDSSVGVYMIVEPENQTKPSDEIKDMQNDDDVDGDLSDVNGSRKRASISEENNDFSSVPAKKTKQDHENHLHNQSEHEMETHSSDKGNDNEIFSEDSLDSDISLDSLDERQPNRLTQSLPPSFFTSERPMSSDSLSDSEDVKEDYETQPRQTKLQKLARSDITCHDIQSKQHSKPKPKMLTAVSLDQINISDPTMFSDQPKTCSNLDGEIGTDINDSAKSKPISSEEPQHGESVQTGLMERLSLNPQESITITGYPYDVKDKQESDNGLFATEVKSHTDHTDEYSYIPKNLSEDETVINTVHVSMPEVNENSYEGKIEPQKVEKYVSHIVSSAKDRLDLELEKEGEGHLQRDNAEGVIQSNCETEKMPIDSPISDSFGDGKTHKETLDSEQLESECHLQEDMANKMENSPQTVCETEQIPTDCSTTASLDDGQTNKLITGSGSEGLEKETEGYLQGDNENKTEEYSFTSPADFEIKQTPTTFSVPNQTNIKPNVDRIKEKDSLNKSVETFICDTMSQASENTNYVQECAPAVNDNMPGDNMENSSLKTTEEAEMALYNSVPVCIDSVLGKKQEHSAVNNADNEVIETPKDISAEDVNTYVKDIICAAVNVVNCEQGSGIDILPHNEVKGKDSCLDSLPGTGSEKRTDIQSIENQLETVDVETTLHLENRCIETVRSNDPADIVQSYVKDIIDVAKDRVHSQGENEGCHEDSIQDLSENKLVGELLQNDMTNEGLSAESSEGKDLEHDRSRSDSQGYAPKSTVVVTDENDNIVTLDANVSEIGLIETDVDLEALPNHVNRNWVANIVAQNLANDMTGDQVSNLAKEQHSEESFGYEEMEETPLVSDTSKHGGEERENEQTAALDYFESSPPDSDIQKEVQMNVVSLVLANNMLSDDQSYSLAQPSLDNETGAEGQKSMEIDTDSKAELENESVCMNDDSDDVTGDSQESDKTDRVKEKESEHCNNSKDTKADMPVRSDTMTDTVCSDHLNNEPNVSEESKINDITQDQGSKEESTSKDTSFDKTNMGKTKYSTYASQNVDPESSQATETMDHEVSPLVLTHSIGVGTSSEMLYDLDAYSQASDDSYLDTQEELEALQEVLDNLPAR